MSKVLVIELPDETDLTETIKAMNAVQVANIDRCRVFAAVREDAEAVLAVFDANKADPTRSRHDLGRWRPVCVPPI